MEAASTKPRQRSGGGGPGDHHVRDEGEVGAVGLDRADGKQGEDRGAVPGCGARVRGATGLNFDTGVRQFRPRRVTPFQRLSVGLAHRHRGCVLIVH